MSVTVRILRTDGEIINEADFASSDQDCICVDRRGLFRFGPMPRKADSVERASILEARVSGLEFAVGRLQAQDAGGRPDLRDMGATLVDKARARWLEAKAAKLEAEIREDHGAPPDDGHSPVHIQGWNVEGRHDLTITRATLIDIEGREYKLNFPPDQARELAEALLSGARFAETGRGR